MFLISLVTDNSDIMNLNFKVKNYRINDTIVNKKHEKFTTVFGGF